MQTIIYKMDKQQGPLYSQENSIQYFLIYHNEEYEKEYAYIYTYIYITISFWCTAEINTMLCYTLCYTMIYNIELKCCKSIMLQKNTYHWVKI